MRVTVDDAIIDVDDRGGGDAVVLLHGFPLTRAIWDEQANALAKRHRVIRPDLRGMGDSTSSDGPYLMESLAADIAAVLDACGVWHASIVGHSLGGYVALAFARMYAERVDRLALVCSRLAADSEQIASGRNALADTIERDGSGAALDDLAAQLFSSQTWQARPEAVARYREIVANNGAKGLAAMLRGMAQRSPSDDIAGDLTMPVLVVAGTHDRLLSIEEAGSTATEFVNGELVVLEQSGHLPMLEQPAETTAALERWLARV